MCFSQLSNATGGLVGGPMSGFGVIKSIFGNKKPAAPTGAVTTAGTPGPSPSNIGGH